MNRNTTLARGIQRIPRKYFGILCMLGSGLCFSLMTVFIRLAGDLPTFEKAFFRNAIAAVLMFAVMLRKRESFRPGKGNVKYLIGRSLAGGLGLVCNFYAVDRLALSDANMLNKMSPFFAIIFCYFLIGERLNMVQAVGVIVAFIGSLFILKPTFDLSAMVPSVIGLLGGLGAGIAYAFVRKLGTRGERSNMIVLFFSVFSTLMILPAMIATYEPMSWKQLLYLLLGGTAACGGQICITRAYTFAPAREISIYDYSQIIFSSLLGWMIFGQVADGYSFLGYGIIIGMALIMFFYNQKHT